MTEPSVSAFCFHVVFNLMSCLMSLITAQFCCLTEVFFAAALCALIIQSMHTQGQKGLITESRTQTFNRWKLQICFALSRLSGSGGEHLLSRKHCILRTLNSCLFLCGHFISRGGSYRYLLHICMYYLKVRAAHTQATAKPTGST